MQYFGRHEKVAVLHGGGADVLVDAPGSGDEAELVRAGDPGADCARGDVEQAAGHRGSLGEPRFRCRLRGDAAADLAGLAERGQLVPDVGDSERFEHRRVVAQRVHVHEVQARIVSDFRERLPGEAVPNVVLAHEDPAGSLERCRVMIPEPGEERCGLGCPDGLAGVREDPLVRSVGFPPGHVLSGPGIGRIDSVMGRLPRGVHEVHPVAVAGHGEGRDLPRGGPRLLHDLRNDAHIRGPEGIHILFGVPGMGKKHLGLHTGNGDFRAGRVVQGSLGDRSPVIDSHEQGARLHAAQL